MNVAAVRQGSDTGSELLDAAPLTQNELGKEDFLKLLVTQLQNQDPLQPMDNKDLVLQLSQFSTLEQTQNMNENFTAFLGISNMGTAGSMIGKEVAFYDAENGNEVTKAIVDKVIIKNNEVVLSAGGKEVKMAHILSIGQAPPAE